MDRSEKPPVIDYADPARPPPVEWVVRHVHVLTGAGVGLVLAGVALMLVDDRDPQEGGPILLGLGGFFLGMIFSRRRGPIK